MRKPLQDTLRFNPQSLTISLNFELRYVDWLRGQGNVVVKLGGKIMKKNKIFN